jgi:putative phosphoesterase
MKIAILSDSHDNIPNLKKAVSLIKQKKIKTVIHCGDICAAVTLKKAFLNFKGKIHIVFGNVDGDRFFSAKDSLIMPHIKFWGEFGEIRAGKKKIAFTHSPKLARALAQTGKYDLVFYGHSHKPWEEKVGKTRLVNPGNIANIFYRPSFAIYDTKTNKLELVILS